MNNLVFITTPTMCIRIIYSSSFQSHKFCEFSVQGDIYISIIEIVLPAWLPY